MFDLVLRITYHRYKNANSYFISNSFLSLLISTKWYDKDREWFFWGRAKSWFIYIIVDWIMVWLWCSTIPRRVCTGYSSYGLLATTEPITNTEWKTFEIEFKSSEDLNCISLEAYYAKDTEDPYNGHILIDALSEIIQIPCELEE